MAEARALWYVGKGRSELRPVEIAPPAADQVVVKAIVSGISRGTESLVFHGLVPESEWQRMRAPHQEGELPFPVKYGYALVGHVAEGPSDLLRRRVFCLHPHQSLCLLHREDVTVVDDALPSDRAVLAANMETALNALWDGSAGPADRIAVVGAGVVGLLTAALAARLPGAEVVVVDVEESRRAVAEELGVSFAMPDAAPGDRDLVIHASSSSSGLETALRLAGFEGRIVEVSWYGSAPVTVRLGEAFHARRLQLVSSQVGSVAASRRARWSRSRRLSAAMSLLKDDRLDSLLDEACRFEDAPDHLDRWLGRSGGGLCHRLHYA